MDTTVKTSIEFLETKKPEIIRACCESHALKSQYGTNPEKAALLETGFSWTIDGLAAALKIGNMGILSQQAQWGSSHLPTQGFDINKIIKNMNVLSMVIKELASDEVFETVEGAITHLREHM